MGRRVDEALCFGWIDSVQRRSTPDVHAAVLTAQAEERLVEINKQRVARLIANRRDGAPRTAENQGVKRDGSWRALDSVERLDVPPDLTKALAADSAAQRHVDAFSTILRRRRSS